MSLDPLAPFASGPLRPAAGSGNERPLIRQNSRYERLRALRARLFAGVGFAATFFGLAMLVIFVYRLGADVVVWFQTTPVLIQERNEELRAEVVRSESYIPQQLAGVDRFMEAELQGATTEEEKQAIRKDYEKIKVDKKSQLDVTLQEQLATASHDYRADTSPLSLLGHFFTSGPSDVSSPQDAGIAPALLGSIFLALITIVCAVPLGVGAAIYLEEYRNAGWLARIIQVNISNLAGVPSVVYGILGAFVFVELIFKPLENQYPFIAARNLLGGGLTLAMLTLPVVIIASQEAIRAVPLSIRHAALALGATRWQVIRHHVLPGAFPGILTGTILAVARALGEAAPLVLFGALLYVSQSPSLFSRFTVLPMQIFGWTDRPQDAWRANAAVVSIVLVLTILALNALAIFLRYRAQRTAR